MPRLVYDRRVQNHFLYLLLEDKSSRIVRAGVRRNRRLLSFSGRFLFGFLNRDRRRCGARRTVVRIPCSRGRAALVLRRILRVRDCTEDPNHGDHPQS